MTSPLRYLGAAISVAVFTVSAAGCSSKTAAPPAASSTAPSASATSTTPAPAAGLTIPVQISHGNVTPTNAEYEAKVNEPITFTVDSDAADELHVHSVPEHEFEIKPAAGQKFTFTVTVPGQVVVELHGSDKTVATLTVR